MTDDQIHLYFKRLSGKFGKYVGLGCLNVTNRLFIENKLWTKVLFSQASVILSTGRHLPGQTPPQLDTPRQTPPEQTQPPAQADTPRHPPGRRLLLRTMHILLECILVP